MENGETTSRPQVTIIIVNFNGGELLTRSAGGALSSPLSVEIIVVDNGSTDGSIERLREACGRDERLVIIENGKNLGFARASNIAMQRARGEYWLLLNPDCIVEKDTLKSMVEALEEHPDAGITGCLIRNPDGSEQAGCRRSVPTPWRTAVRVFHLDRLLPNHRRFRNFVLCQEALPDGPCYIEGISGAFMLARREAVEQVGLLDEGYFLHCEDLDWCMRFRKAGWKILFVPDLEVVHYQGTCSAARPVFVCWHKHKGMVRFYRKFFRHQYPLPLMVFVVGSVWARFGLLAIRETLRLTRRQFHGVGNRGEEGGEQVAPLHPDSEENVRQLECETERRRSAQAGHGERHHAAGPR